jgi:hypothetical protein
MVPTRSGLIKEESRAIEAAGGIGHFTYRHDLNDKEEGNQKHKADEQLFRMARAIFFSNILKPVKYRKQCIVDGQLYVRKKSTPRDLAHILG